MSMWNQFVEEENEEREKERLGYKDLGSKGNRTKDLN